MKISAKQYAQALYDLSLTKDFVVADFVRFLITHRGLKKVKDILAHYHELSSDSVEVNLASARELSGAIEKEIAAFLKTKINTDTLKITKTIDPSLLGGFVAKFRDQVIDASIKNNLNILKHNINEQ